jgi:hypothetical protein
MSIAKPWRWFCGPLGTNMKCTNQVVRYLRWWQASVEWWVEVYFFWYLGPKSVIIMSDDGSILTKFWNEFLSPSLKCFISFSYIPYLGPIKSHSLTYAVWLLSWLFGPWQQHKAYCSHHHGVVDCNHFMVFSQWLIHIKWCPTAEFEFAFIFVVNYLISLL